MTTPTLDPLLAATRECVMDVGLKRTTLADVARRAGVSRMTLYRRFDDMRSLVADLMTREFTELMREARASTDGGTGRERLVATATASVEALWRNPLLARVLDVDPELLLPLVTDRFGSTQKATIDLVAEQIAEGQRDGSIRAVDPMLAATCLQLTAQSFVFSARVVEGQDVLPELRRLLEGYLIP
jgi:AcrR family transcriptional regulator